MKDNDGYVLGRHHTPPAARRQGRPQEPQASLEAGEEDNDKEQQGKKARQNHVFASLLKGLVQMPWLAHLVPEAKPPSCPFSAASLSVHTDSATRC